MPGWNEDTYQSLIRPQVYRGYELIDFRAPEPGEWFLYGPDSSYQFADQYYTGMFSGTVEPHPIVRVRIEVLPPGVAPQHPGAETIAVPNYNPPQGTVAAVWYGGNIQLYLNEEHLRKLSSDALKLAIKS